MTSLDILSEINGICCHREKAQARLILDAERRHFLAERE
jgi:hypothetical protein